LRDARQTQTKTSRPRRGGLLSEDTINKHKGALRVFFKYCNEEEIEVNNIVIKQKKKRDRTPKVKGVLSHEEIQWLYSVTDSTVFGIRDRCMLALYYGCGIRRSEGLNLELTDIDFNKGRILIRQPKNKRDRYVLMSPRVQHFVEEYVYRVPMHGESMDARLEVLWNRVKERYPIEKPKIGLHLLRHSLGTHLYLAGMEIEKIALMLGHRCLEATQIYINLAQLLKP
jgi:integrase/recombinase XerD